MSYQVLAQKYRPQSFDDVMGQEAVTRTLKNAIIQSKTANAYIFSGPRGVGKTSVARILAKALNCEASAEKRPCGECSSCLEITRGTSIDVIEIDGASNNGVDEIRTLRENVKFSPSKGRYRIYIIDEVHMLTTGAFNALLKTLEEPPAHVKFVFATTESHKVLPTILSRCQSFDFKRIPPKTVYEALMAISQKEKIQLEDKAALLIARSSDGSLRDALVILDQMIAFSGVKIEASGVVELLGIIKKDRIFELAEAVIGADIKKTAVMVDGFINDGKDPAFVANALLSHFRDVMIIKAAGEPTADMALADDELAKIREHSRALSIEEVLYILQNLSHSLVLMKSAMFARGPLEITLMRLAMRAQAMALPEALAKLEQGQGAGRGAQGGSQSAERIAQSEMPHDARRVTRDESHSAERRAQSEMPHDARRVTRDESQADDNDEIGTGAGIGISKDPGKAHWSAVLNYIRNKKMSVFTFLSPAKPVEFTRNKVVIGFGKEHKLNRDILDVGDNRLMVEEAVNKVTGSVPKIEFTVIEALTVSAQENAACPVTTRSQDREMMKPYIDKVMDVFGGQIVRDISEDAS